MVENISAAKAGLVLGTLIGGWHLCWAICVALGIAPQIIDFILWMHFIKPVFVIESFDVMRAIILVAVTAGLGFVIGGAFALIWNALHRK